MSESRDAEMVDLTDAYPDLQQGKSTPVEILAIWRRLRAASTYVGHKYEEREIAAYWRIGPSACELGATTPLRMIVKSQCAASAWNLLIRCLSGLAVMLAVCATCRSENDDSGATLENDFEAAPAWAGMSQGEVPKRGDLLLNVIKRISRLPERDVRDFVKRFLLKRRRNVVEGHVWSKIYVLNRVYFAVPVNEVRPNFKFFGGWGGIPRKDENTLNILWPLEETAEGELRLTGVFGGYFGPDYRALDEFDFFALRYGVRPMPREGPRRE